MIIAKVLKEKSHGNLRFADEPSDGFRIVEDER